MSDQNDKLGAINTMIEELYQEGMKKSEEYAEQILHILKLDGPVEKFAGATAAVHVAVQILIEQGMPPEEIQKGIMAAALSSMIKIGLEKAGEKVSEQTADSEPQPSEKARPN